MCVLCVYLVCMPLQNATLDTQMIKHNLNATIRLHPYGKDWRWPKTPSSPSSPSSANATLAPTPVAPNVSTAARDGGGGSAKTEGGGGDSGNREGKGDTYSEARARGNCTDTASVRNSSGLSELGQALALRFGAQVAQAARCLCVGVGVGVGVGECVDVGVCGCGCGCVCECVCGCVCGCVSATPCVLLRTHNMGHECALTLPPSRPPARPAGPPARPPIAALSLSERGWNRWAQTDMGVYTG